MKKKRILQRGRLLELFLQMRVFAFWKCELIELAFHWARIPRMRARIELAFVECELCLEKKKRLEIWSSWLSCEAITHKGALKIVDAYEEQVHYLCHMLSYLIGIEAFWYRSVLFKNISLKSFFFFLGFISSLQESRS